MEIVVIVINILANHLTIILTDLAFLKFGDYNYSKRIRDRDREEWRRDGEDRKRTSEREQVRK